MKVMEPSAKYLVQPRYKRTEVGVIPEDWDVRTIAAASRKIMDYRGRTPKKLGLDWGDGDIPALSAGNVRMGYIDFAQECYLASEALYRRWMVHGEVEKDDVVFTTEAPLGNVALIPDHKKYVLSQRTVLLQTNKQSTYSPFLYQVLMSETFQRTLQDNASGSTAQGIKRKVFETLATVSPPMVEQKTIAEALSDADALIESLDQLIAKKRDLKQGAMQELLTGKRRLPRFGGEWTTHTLGEVMLHCSSGATPYRGNPDYYKGTVNWISSGELNYNRIFETAEHISQDAVEKANLKLHPIGTFLMAITGLEAAGTRGSCGIVGSPATTNQSCMAIYPSSELRTEFLFHWYVLSGDELALEYCQGTKQQSYTAKIVKVLPINLPPSVEEQTAIATILSDMDTELAELQSRLAKARQIKQGMMQELLTGRIRLL